MSNLSTLLGGYRAFGRGYIDGLILSNNVSDANNDIDIAVGECRDSSNAVDMALLSAITKRLDAAWAVGSGNGGLDTGNKANSTWYHVYLIMRLDTGVVDALFSTSATSPTMPANYNYNRRIGSVLTDGSGNIRAFYQTGNMFLWKTSIYDANAASVGTTAINATISTPLGVETFPILTFTGYKAGGAPSTIISSPNVNDQDPASNFSWLHASPATSVVGFGVIVGSQLATNTSSQIRVRSDNASTSYYIRTYGWIDPRGSEGGFANGVGSALVMPRGYIDGLVLSNNGGDANNDIDIAAGVCRDGSDLANIVLGSSITKRLDAAWAVGTNQGGLDTGAKGSSTWYHVWLISNGSTTDALFSTSATAPTMPAGYSYKRRLGAVLTNGSSNILAFTQVGDQFIWSSVPADISDATLGTSAKSYTLSVPTGIKVLVTFNINYYNTEAAAGVYLSSLSASDEAGAAGGRRSVAAVYADASSFSSSGQVTLLTNTSGQIRARGNRATGNQIDGGATDWIDPRGRDA
jgi:hypothetical protein